MNRFVRLELARYRRTSLYLAGAAAASLLGAFYLFALIGRLDSSPDAATFRSYDAVIALGLVIALCVVAIFGAALYARLVVTDYLGDNRIQLYSYPNGRAPLFSAKNIAFGLVLTVSTLIGFLVAVGVFFAAEAIIPVVRPDVADPSWWLTAVAGPLGVVGLALSTVMIAGVIGIRRQSAVTTIVATVIILAALGNVVAISATGMVWITVATAALGVAVMVIVLRMQAARIQTEEVL